MHVGFYNRSLGDMADSRPSTKRTKDPCFLGGLEGCWKWKHVRIKQEDQNLNKVTLDKTSMRLETTELLGSLLGGLVLGDLEDVETNSLGEGTALANGDGVANLDTESGRNVGGNVLVTLLVTRVLGDEVEVLSADDDGTGHLGRDNLAGEDTATDGNETSPGALLVC